MTPNTMVEVTCNGIARLAQNEMRAERAMPLQAPHHSRWVSFGAGLAWNTALPYTLAMRTVAETPIFQRYVDEIWSTDERNEFISWIASNPEAGELITGSGGCRKVRWAGSGRGKRGGARVIYFLEAEDTIWLLIVYTKGKFDKLPTSFLAQLKQGVEDAL